MGNHRSDVEPSGRPVDQVTPYVGRRRALPIEEQAPETPSPSSYVGRRRAAPVEPVVPIAATQAAHEPAGQAVAIGPVPTTAELQALVERSLDETAPRPRITARLAPQTRPAQQAPRPADTLPRLDVPMPRRSPDPATALTVHTPAPLFADDSRTDIPAVGRPEDLAADQTITLPLTMPAPTTSAGRRRAAGIRHGRRRALPSLPVAAGLASIAVAVTGVVTTGHASLAPMSSHHLVQASAMTGFSGSGTVGDRQSLSRSSDGRSSIASLAAIRNQALDKTNNSAVNYDKQLAKNLWVLPIDAGVYHLTGRFGDVSGLWRTIHTGLDFACPTDTPIHAIANGTITFVGWDGSYGNKTVETLADGTEIWYAHQNKFGTQVGATVKQGEVIGYVGSTGNTTGPHVHIEVRPGGGDPVDPDPAFKEHGVDPDANQ